MKSETPSWDLDVLRVVNSSFLASDNPGPIRKVGGPTAGRTAGPPVYTMGAGELAYNIGTLKCYRILHQNRK